jgi:hypothetical protein
MAICPGISTSVKSADDNRIEKEGNSQSEKYDLQFLFVLDSECTYVLDARNFSSRLFTSILEFYVEALNKN